MVLGVLTQSTSCSGPTVLGHHAVSRTMRASSHKVTDVTRPEILRMSELNDNSELQKYSSAVLYVLSAVDPPEEYVGVIASNFLQAIKSSTVSSHQDSLQ